MRQLNPVDVVLHCGLHKTGSTYIQRNLQTNKEILLENGILYIGPKTLRKTLRQIWHHMDKGKPIKSIRHKKRLKQQMQRFVAQLPLKESNEIHTILISSEAIFGKLRDGFKPHKSTRNNTTGIYRHTGKRSTILLSAIENSFHAKPLKYKILYIKKNQHTFEKSCYAQLIKEGQKHVAQMDFDTFRLKSDFSHASDAFLKKSLSGLQSKHELKIISINYEAAANHNKPSELLWHFLDKALPNHSQKIQNQITSDSTSSNLDKIHNPGLNEKGLLLARLSVHIHNRHERKRFRKFLEKNFNKSYQQKQAKLFASLRILRYHPANNPAINERGNAIELYFRPHLNADELIKLRKFLNRHYSKIN